MPNQSGKLYGLSTLCPIRNGGEQNQSYASMLRQTLENLEFVQQQWVQSGNDFRMANDSDPILGNHGPNDGSAESGQGRMVMQADPRGDRPPFLCNKIPTFVETRGGDYFFVPSMTALQLIGAGIVDPT